MESFEYIFVCVRAVAALFCLVASAFFAYRKPVEDRKWSWYLFAAVLLASPGLK